MYGGPEDLIMVETASFEQISRKASDKLIKEPGRDEGTTFHEHVIVEEPTSPSCPPELSTTRVDIEELPSSPLPTSPLPTDMEIEEEVGVLLSKRKRVEEDKAERKAKRIYEQLQREGLELDEVIDAVAKDHGEMHEKATVIRLGFEDEREKFISQVREAGAYTHEELPFDYGFDEAEDSDDMNVASSTRETEQSVTLEGLKDTVVQAVSTAAASPPTRKKVRFVSPIKVSPAKPSEP